MSLTRFQHSEAFLQWIWENLLFDFTRLRTTCGKHITMGFQGRLNVTDGPDFKNASIEIDGIEWHGDVEIHTKANHWYSHKHHLDENYNSVILHVVADDAAKDVSCENGSRPFTLNLLPHLSKELHVFLRSFEHPEVLPCSSSFHIISEEIFEQQIEKAHKEYLEKKANDFLSFYPPGKVMSKAWKEAFIISLWDGLGISQNRHAMRSVAAELLNQSYSSAPDMLERALEIAGFSGSISKIKWNVKSVRPAGHPENRIRQAVLLTSKIIHHPFSDFLNEEVLLLWKQWLKDSSLKNSGHFQILYGTVFLPALYMLGKLLAHQRLSGKVFQEWKNLKTPIPPSLLSSFKDLPVSNKIYGKKLGAVHQIKSYCGSGKCSECLVLKKAILS